jgi:hypothetical protein
VPGDRANRHHAVAHAHQDLRARSGDREAAEVEEEQERCRIDPAQRAVEREGESPNGASKRCDSTTWKMSPAAMYSLARATIAWNSSGLVFEVGGTASGPAIAVRGFLVERPVECVHHGVEPLGRAIERGRALTPGSGRTGVTSVIVSSTVLEHDHTVGRTMMASAMPTGSCLRAGSSSISRTMS